MLSRTMKTQTFLVILRFSTFTVYQSRGMLYVSSFLGKRWYHIECLLFVVCVGLSDMQGLRYIRQNPAWKEKCIEYFTICIFSTRVRKRCHLITLQWLRVSTRKVCLLSRPGVADWILRWVLELLLLPRICFLLFALLPQEPLSLSFSRNSNLDY